MSDSLKTEIKDVNYTKTKKNNSMLVFSNNVFKSFYES